MNRLFLTGTQFGHRFYDLRDHITSSFDKNSIPDPQVFFTDIFFVMFLNAADSYATNGHRLKFDNRGNGPGAAYLKFHIE